jgi:predicted enzyme related to lactoylglutathione lyase
MASKLFPEPKTASRRMYIHNILKITLRSSDFARTERFYSELFDWKFHQYSTTYLGFEPPSGIGGGFQRRDSFTQGDSYLLYIVVDEFASYLRRIPELGGQTSGEVEVVSDSESYVRVYDPDGNRLALWRNSQLR